jgi:hypothetical protein
MMQEVSYGRCHVRYFDSVCVMSLTGVRWRQISRRKYTYNFGNVM